MASRLQVRVLGPIEVSGHDGPVTLRGRLGCIVASLVARRGAAVPTDVLVDDVFGEELPAGATSTIHGYVHRVRSRAPGIVESTPAGYRLGVDVEVDADRFEAECRAGHLAASAESLEAACASFDAALARWRGPAYADYCDRDFVQAEAAGLEEMRRTAEDARLEVLAQSQHATDLVVDLERAVASEPSREIRWTLLIDALARSGRVPDAARAAARYRSFLRDEYGLAPTPEFEACVAAAADPCARIAPAAGRSAVGCRDEIDRILTEARQTLRETEVVPASIAAEAALAASDRLVALGALDAADEWLGEVIDAIGDADPHRVVRAHLARADLRAHAEDGDWLESALAAAPLADGLGDMDSLVQATLLNPTQTATGSSERVALLRKVLNRIPTDDPRYPLLLAQLGIELGALEHGARAVIDEAWASASAIGDDTARAAVTVALLNDAGRFLAPDERGALAAELDAYATNSGRGDASWLAAAHRYWTAVQQASACDRASALDAVKRRLPARREMAEVRRAALLIRAIDAFIAGRLDDADELLAASDVATPRGGDTIGTAQGNRHGVLLRLRREQGRLMEFVGVLGGHLGMFARLLAPSALALAQAELGRPDEARAALARCHADEYCPVLFLPHVWSVRVEAAVLMGDVERAATDAQRLEPYAGQVLCGTRGCDGAVDRYLGLAAAVAGDCDAADRWLANAITLHERIASPTYLTRTLYDRARWLDDTDAGAEALRLAHRHRLPALLTALGDEHHG